MRGLVVLAAAFALALPACGGCDGGEAGPDAGYDATPYTACDGDAAEFTRHAMLAIAGRRPASQAEVDVYVDLAEAVDAAGTATDGTAGRAAILDALLDEPRVTDRWVEQLMDALRVQRVDVQSQAACWGDARRMTVEPGLAASVRDAAATGVGDGAEFTLLDLARSAIKLDDVSPLLRAQLFAMVALPIPAANVPPIEAELARRADFGATFDAAYLNRDLVCLGCHTSEASVTDRDDPATDRHWPVDGWPETAIYGDASGIAADRAHAAFRVDGFVAAGDERPWGWAPACGVFAPPASIADDPAGVDGYLGSLRGNRLTVYDLEAALGRGFERLRGMPPEVTPADGRFADADQALAWLVSMTVVEQVWREVIGTPLTIANYFPRSSGARDMLADLTRGFVTDGFSLRALLARILATDFFARQAPDAGCGAGPYAYPTVWDPWVTSDPDPARHGNGAGDAIAPLSARTLLSASQAALDWPAPASQAFPDLGEFGCEGLSCPEAQGACQQFDYCCATAEVVCAGDMPEGEFQRGVGTFLRNGERGFRGLDFQARLVWEARLGACVTPAGAEPDFVDDLRAAATALPDAIALDLVSALKDRIVGEPDLIDDAERAAVAAVIGTDLDAPASSVNEAALRRLCGTLLASPQFLLQGVAGRGGSRPRLTPSDAGYAAVCQTVAERAPAGWAVTCGDDTLTVAAP